MFRTINGIIIALISEDKILFPVWGKRGCCGTNIKILWSISENTTQLQISYYSNEMDI